MSDRREGETGEIRERIKVVEDVPTALALWAEHERRGYRLGRLGPQGLENETFDAGGPPIERQAAVYVREVRFYARAYPVLWWEWVQRKELADFSAREYCALMRRDLVRNEVAAREKLGWLLPHKDGRRLWTPFEIVMLFEKTLKAELTAHPLRVLEPEPPQCAADVADKVEEAARKKWGWIRSLRDR